MNFRQWQGFKQAPTQFASNKNTPGTDYAPHTDNIDTCLVCGVEIPPGPDFCGAECEAKAAGEPATTPSEPTAGDLNG